MDDDVLLADGGKAVAVELADALGEADVERLEHEIAALGDDELRRVGEPQHALLDEYRVVADVELLHDEPLQARGHEAVDLEANDAAAPAALECRLIGGDEVLRLLLHLDVTVAQDAEGAVAAGEKSREQPRQMHADHGLDADEADRRHVLAGCGRLQGQADEAHQLHRDRDQRVHGGAVTLAPELDADGDAAVLDEGEGMRGVDGDRRQDRQILGCELPVEPFAFGRRQLLRLDDVDVGRDHLRLERGPARLLVADEAGGEAVDLGELLGGGEAILAQAGDAGRDLAVDAGHAHHVELVDVVGRDRQEAQALEQGMALVLRFLHDAAIELKPGELAVVEAGRTQRHRRQWHGRLRRLCLRLFLQSRFRRAHSCPAGRGGMSGNIATRLAYKARECNSFMKVRWRALWLTEHALPE